MLFVIVYFKGGTATQELVATVGAILKLCNVGSNYENYCIILNNDSCIDSYLAKDNISKTYQNFTKENFINGLKAMKGRIDGK